MWGLENLGIPVNPADGTMTLPLWAIGLAAALLAVFFLLALARAGLAGTLSFLIVSAFAIWAGLAWTEHERNARHAALEDRLAALNARPMVPGSSLGCLDFAAGEALEAACERSIFASPEAVAAAAAFMAERLDMLAQFVRQHESALSWRLDELRKGVERDPFALVSHVLATRDGCSADKCAAFDLLREAETIRANMRDNAFNARISRHAGNWSTPASQTAAVGAPAPSAPAGNHASPLGTVATPVGPRYTLPSAASIPPVSIMTPEPAPASGSQTEAAGTAATPAPPPPRRPARPVARAPAPAPAAPPIRLTPATPPAQ